MNLVKKVALTNHCDDRGSLAVIEAGKDIPFQIKRIYYIYGTKHNLARGFHAHKTLKQLFVCVSGACTVKIDDGKTSNDIRLDSPSEGVLLDRPLWREMRNFTEDCVLLVLASEGYDESDYLRNYEEFLDYVK